MARSGTLAAASALAGAALPFVHAAENNTIRLALIGCGGRGSGAAANAFDSPHGPVRMIAMADLFGNRLANAHKVLTEKYASQMDVPPERRFTGFDAWRKAIDCLRPGDVAMLTGYAGFRPRQLEYAVEKGVNVFMEKSFAVDPPAVRRVIQAGAKGFLKKNSDVDMLVDAIRLVAAGRVYIDPTCVMDLAVNQMTKNLDPLSVLTPREFEIFRLLAEGMTTASIAKKISISGKTVGVHHANIMRKLNLENGAQLVRLAIRSRIIDL